MKAVQFFRFGPAAEVAEAVDLPDPPPPGPGEVLVDILAAPINPSDFLVFEGSFGAKRPVLPAFGGGEAVGRIVELGQNIEHLRVGDRVLALYAGRGNWRQRVIVPAAALFALPQAADTLQLAMMAVNPATAWHMLTGFVDLKPGEWVLQNAGNSAVGHNVIRLARRRGWRTVNLVRRPDQIAPLMADGADLTLVDGPDLAARVAEAVGGAPVRLAFDAVAGEATGRLATAICEGGTIVTYGLLSGETCTVGAAELVFRDLRLRGFWLSQWFQGAAADEKKRLYDEIAGFILDGTIAVPIEATYPLERIREALAHAKRPGRAGKILMIPNPE